MLTNRSFHVPALLCIMIALTFLISGCWDRKEIENRGFVLGIAIDHVTTPEPKGRYDLPHVTQEAGTRKYRVTFELPEFRKKEAETTVAQAEEHLIFTGEGESMAAISRAINAKIPFGLFYEDIQIIVFSEAVAREGIGDVLDYFTRNPGMRQRVKLFVTPGRAEDILTSKLQQEELNSTVIAKIAKNVHFIPSFATNIDIAGASKAIRNKSSFPLPMVVIEQGDIKLTQAAIFNKNKKMVGIVGEEEIPGAKILRTNLTQGIFSIPHPANPEKLVIFELMEPNIKVDAHLQDDRLWFTVEAKFVGNLSEKTEAKQKALNPAFLAAVEQELAADFTRQVQATYRTLQELKTDTVELGGLVHRQHPQYWKKVKDRWDDEVFPTVPLEVSIKVVVRRPGMTS